MTPGTITTVSAGTRQGIYRPQVRLYYHHTKHGILFETLTMPLQCKSRKRAIEVAKEWIKTPDFEERLEFVKERIASNPDNTLQT